MERTAAWTKAIRGNFVVLPFDIAVAEKWARAFGALSTTPTQPVSAGVPVMTGIPTQVRSHVPWGGEHQQMREIELLLSPDIP